MGIGAASAAIGAWLSLATADARVWVDNDGYHIGDDLLHRQPDGSYTGDAAVVLSPDRAHGASSLTWSGLHVTARCDVTDNVERCTFTLGRTTVTSVDTLARDTPGWSWERSYSDGVTTRIPLRSMALPVPLPLGR
jgi:hypothetical protein